MKPKTYFKKHMNDDYVEYLQEGNPSWQDDEKCLEKNPDEASAEEQRNTGKTVKQETKEAVSLYRLG